MLFRQILVAVAAAVLIFGCDTTAENVLFVESPSGNNFITFFLTDGGEAAYLVVHNNKTVIDTSYLSFDFEGQPSLKSGMAIESSGKTTKDETWEMPWGEQRSVRNHYNELKINLIESQAPARRLTITFRVYNDGLGFRYSFPDQENLKEVIITDENTQFNLTGDHKVWWTPGDWDIYEHLYNETRLAEIDATTKRNHPNLGKHTYIPENAVNTPVTMKTDKGIYLSFHEADLTDYSGMTLKVDTVGFSLQSELVGSEITGYKVKRNTPFDSPWRTIQIADRAGDLINSNLIVNLNDPNELGDVSWFEPTIYIGIWWEMHVGKSSWDMASGRHGATTENAKKYIDFAAKNDIGAVLVEGWNTGWEHWIGFEDREGVFDFVTAYDDYDLEEVVRYGKERGVDIIMHHETSAAPRTYDQQMDTAFALMQGLGIHAVKTGYVGKIIPKGEYHHGQWMVNHYRKVLETAAKYQVAINAHEPIKPTGIRRTLPNAISREGLRGQEFNAWSVEKGNPPSHLPTVAFTRMLAGPIDFTPGIFNIKMTPYKNGESQINTTLAHQLALYVVIYSPIQMAADLPENYEGHPAFQFIRDVGVDWEQSLVLDGEVGDFVVIARQERGTNKWFLGAITDENERSVKVDLSFLGSGNYTATLYSDGDEAHWNDNPLDYEITTEDVNNSSELTLTLAPGGGTAVSFNPK